MNCPDCNNPTRVINSRTIDSPSKTLPAKTMATAHRLVHWYTPDWVVRVRACTVCRKRTTSLEIFADDFEAIIKEGLPNG